MSTELLVQRREEAFLATYETLASDFEAIGIRHTVIGSLGRAAYTGVALDYDRPSRSPASQIPDIDLLVPREELLRAREYREHLAGRVEFPVKLGLSLPSYIVDWRPNENYSLLNSKRDTSVSTDLLAPRPVAYRNIEIQTLDPRVLAETYGIYAGHVRAKDEGIADALRRYADETGASCFTPEDVEPFVIHRQLEKRHMRNQGINVINRVNARLPEAARNAAKPIVQAVVNKAGWR